MSFELGMISATPAVIDSLNVAWVMQCLSRHVAGDWGVLDKHDTELNIESLNKPGRRILSKYELEKSIGNVLNDFHIYIITDFTNHKEPNITTILFPSEY